MLSPVRKIEDAVLEYLRARNQSTRIESWGTIDINVQEMCGEATITLHEAAYVPSFMTNIVSFSRTIEKGVFWDTEKMLSHAKGKPLCKLSPYNGQRLLENNTRTSANNILSTFMVTVRKASNQRWYETLVRANIEVISHLETSTRGTAIVDSPDAPRMARYATRV